MSLALHYWMGGAHHSSGSPISEMTYTVSSGTLNPSIPYHSTLRRYSGCVVECRICRECAGSNLGRGYFAPRSTQPSIPPGSVNEYLMRLGRQRQVWFIPIADERVGVQVKLHVRSLENTCHTWALLWWWFTKRRYIKYAYLYLYSYYHLHLFAPNLTWP